MDTQCQQFVRFLFSLCLIFVFFFTLTGTSFGFWIPVETPRGISVSSIRATSDSSLYCSGNYKLYHWNRTTARWDSLALPSGWYVLSFAVLRNGTIFFAAGNSQVNGTRLYHSQNGGTTWDTTGTGAVVSCVILAQKGDTLLSFGYTTVHRSTNGGITWGLANNGLPNWAGFDFLSSDDHGRLVGGNPDDGSLFYTTNAGTTWGGSAERAPGHIAAITFLNDTTLLASYGTNHLLAQTTNYGVNWITVPRPSGAVNSFFYDGDSVLYAVGDSGIFRRNIDSTWSSVGTMLHGKCMVRMANGSLVCGSNGTGCFSLNASNRWVTMSSGFPKIPVNDVASRGNNEVLIETDQGLFYSNDECTNWTPLSVDGTPLLVSNAGTFIAGANRLPLGDSVWTTSTTSIGSYKGAVSSSGNIYLLTYGSTFVSQDDGRTWQQMANFPVSMNSPMCIAAFGNGTVLVGSNDGIYRLGPDSTTWHYGTLPQMVYGLAIWNDRTVYAAQQYFSGNLYLSNDTGLTWRGTSIAMNCYNVAVTTDQTIFVDANDGVFLSRNNGNSFQAIPLPGNPIGDISHFSIQNGNGYVFASTYHNGLFRSQYPNAIGDNNSSSLPLSYTLTAYPNPFNPSTVVKFRLSSSVDVSMKLFDINGRLVRTEIAGKMAAGEHSYTIHGDNLATGTYFLKFEAGKSYSVVKKLVLIK